MQHLIPYDLDPEDTQSISLLLLMRELLSFFNLTSAQPPDWKEKVDRLCGYCETMLQTSDMPSDTLVQAIADLQKSKYTPFSIDILQDSARSVFRALFADFTKLKHNENVLLYLIEHRVEWNRYLGTGTIETLLRTLFPSGPNALKATIQEGYIRRGFEAFFTTKEPLVCAIQWDALT